MTNLTEIIVQDLTVGVDNPHRFFVGWQEKLFILDDDSDITPVKAHLRRHPAFKEKYAGTSVYEIVSYAGDDMPPDVVAGDYNPVERTLNLRGVDKANPATSVILRKIIKKLRIKKITRINYATDDEETFDPKKNIAGIPTKGYHGTNTISLQGILKRGIKAGAGIGNFEHRQIHHETEVFFAATFSDATFYAEQSVYDFSKRNVYTGPKKRPGAHRVVLEVKIPDPALVVPDYDAESHSTIDTETPHYTRTSSPETFGAAPAKAITLSKEMGKFGYSGRILPQHITWVYIWSESEERWLKFKPNTLKKLYWERGEDWYYRYGIEI